MPGINRDVFINSYDTVFFAVLLHWLSMMTIMVLTKSTRMVMRVFQAFHGGWKVGQNKEKILTLQFLQLCDNLIFFTQSLVLYI